MTLITDGYFCAVAIPAVFWLGIGNSGFGSLAVPVSVPQAAAILMPVLLLIDLLGFAAFFNAVDRALLKFSLPFGLLGVVIGTVLFKLFDPHLVAGIVGIFTGATLRISTAP